MKIYDISMPVAYAMPVYKGKPSKRPVLTVERDFSTGMIYESRLNINLHTGTHIDAGLHVFPGGSTIEQLSLHKVVGRCRVLDLLHVGGGITEADLMAKTIEAGDFVLLKTQNSCRDILEGNFIFLERSGAEYLARKNSCGVGIDALGIERDQPGYPVHKMLLGAGIVILEGLRLQAVPEGQYLLVAAPICVTGAEAAPVRALLLAGRSELFIDNDI